MVYGKGMNAHQCVFFFVHKVEQLYSGYADVGGMLTWQHTSYTSTSPRNQFKMDKKRKGSLIWICSFWIAHANTNLGKATPITHHHNYRSLHTSYTQGPRLLLHLPLRPLLRRLPLPHLPPAMPHRRVLQQRQPWSKTMSGP